jgi:hypothetical protein
MQKLLVEGKNCKCVGNSTEFDHEIKKWVRKIENLDLFSYSSYINLHTSHFSMTNLLKFRSSDF